MITIIQCKIEVTEPRPCFSSTA